MRWKSGVACAALIAYVIMLYAHDPGLGGFPACPFRYVTGYLCPGCGSQRAVHELMHGRIAEAFSLNALLVISIPLLVCQWAVSRLLIKPLTAYNIVVFAWAAVIIGWGVLRNVFA